MFRAVILDWSGTLVDDMARDAATAQPLIAPAELEDVVRTSIPDPTLATEPGVVEPPGRTPGE